MKKLISILIVILFCFGCSKEDNNITINIYESSEKEVIEQKQELNDDTTIKKVVDNSQETEQTKQEIVVNDVETNIDNELLENKSEMDKITSWYKENKDELSDINNEILEKDKSTIDSIIDKTSSWYEENKDELKQVSQEVYKNDKQTIEDLYRKIKNIE